MIKHKGFRKANLFKMKVPELLKHRNSENELDNSQGVWVKTGDKTTQ